MISSGVKLKDFSGADDEALNSPLSPSKDGKDMHDKGRPWSDHTAENADTAIDEGLDEVINSLA